MKVRVLAIVMLSLFVFLVVGCSNSNPYVGKWKVDAGILTTTADIKSDGTYVVSGGFGGEKGVWKEESDHIVLTSLSNNKSVTAKVDGDNLTINQEGNITVFIRQK